MSSVSTFSIIFVLAISLLGSNKVFAQDDNPNRMHDLYITIMTALIYPNNIEQARSINSTLFAENIKGRVDLTNTFEGRELNTEYLFGLFSSIATNTSFSLLLVPVAFEERGFVSTGNLAATSSLVTFRHAATEIELPVIMDVWFRVDDEGKVTDYETTFKRPNWYFETFYDMVTPILAASRNISVESINDTYREELFKELIAESICKIHEDHCSGENQQYDSFEDCANFITSLPMGESYAFGQDTAICRMLHQEMVPIRPEVHCSHIGPSGGGMCMDRTYVDVTEEVFYDQLLIEDQSDRL